MSDQTRPSSGDHGAGTPHPAHDDARVRDDRLLMAEPSRRALAGTSFAASSAGQDTKAAAHAPLAELPGVDAELLQSPQRLPSLVTRKEAARAFAPMVHRVVPGARGD